MFFILGTGRCGTLSLANTLLDQTDSVCLHEPEPSLIEEAAAYRYGELDAQHIRDLLLRTRVPVVNGQFYGESNQTLALIIPLLSETFPDARYLWLIRSGLDVVASGVGRAWYTGAGAGHKPYERCNAIEKRWIDHRIEGDRCGDVDADTWARMSPFEKTCWYWQYVNRTIEQDLQSYVSPARTRVVALEGLEDQMEEITNWLGLRRMRQEPVALHNQAKYPKHHWTEWNDAEWAAFERWCGPLMDRCYPQWREVTGRANGATAWSASPAAPPADVSMDRSAGGDVDALIREGELRFQEGDVAGARALFERAAAGDDRNPTILNNLAVCLWAAGETGQALLHAARGLELAPDDRSLVINGGRILRSCDRAAEARALYTSYLADYPDDAEVRHALDEVDELQEEPSPEVTGAADAVSGDPDTLNEEGERHFAEGELDAAEACFERALAHAPEHIEVLNNLGVVRWQRGDDAGALDFLRRALESGPERRETVANLALMLRGMGHNDTMAMLLGSYMERHPEDDEMRAFFEASSEDPGVRTASR